VARSPAGEDIAPARVTELPLAFNQERRLFLEDALRMRRAPFLPFFVSSGSEISGSFSVSALEEALNAVVGRHGALRSAIAASRTLPDEDRHIALDTYRRTGVCRSGVYVQSLHDQVTVRLRRRTLGAESGDQDAEIAALVDRECAATYDLSAPPLMRALLLERHEHEQLLVVVWHHLVSDGWSTQVFRAELEREYARIVTRASEHGALPYSYERFAASQHQEAQDGRFRPALDYWARQWERFERAQWTMRDLPVSHASPAVAGETAAQTSMLGEAAFAGLGAQARECGVTMFVFCLAAGALWLHRLTGRRLVPIWTNFANRTPETDQTIGWLANSHLVGFELEPNPTGYEVVHQTRRVMRDAMAAQAMPLPLLWRSLGTSLINGIGIAFDFDPGENPRRRRGGRPPLALKRVILPGTRQALVHLQVMARVVGDDIMLRLSHATDLCTADDAQRLVAALRSTLVTMIADPRLRASAMPSMW
jgi:hypothetical protein